MTWNILDNHSTFIFYHDSLNSVKDIEGHQVDEEFPHSTESGLGGALFVVQDPFKPSESGRKAKKMTNTEHFFILLCCLFDVIGL